jgi:putative ABC transport system permease protein
LIIWNLLDWIIFTLILFLLIFVLSFIIKYILNFVYKKSYFLKNKSFYIYDSIRSTVNPWNLSILISFGFIISFTSLLFISIISLNFLDKLNIDLNNNNNIYVINLNEKDLENIDDLYKDQSYSIILWRILSINGKNLKEHLWTSGESGQFTREFNITDNELNDVKILEWNEIKTWEVSVDDDFSKSLNLKLWDQVEFQIYGIKKKLIVSNIRQSISEWVQPFFYFQVQKEDFIDFPKSYFLSTYVPLDNIKQFKNDFLAKTWNQISFIELDVILEEIKSISNKVLIVIQVLFIYVFIFCTISLIISIIFLIPFKKKKSYLYNILWAQKKYIKKNNLFEYFYLQSLSFIISIIIASSSTYYILNKSNFINFW